MEGYEAGQRPPGLAEDGSFDTPLGGRSYSIVGNDGSILAVDRQTGLLAKDVPSPDDDEQ